MKKAEGKKESRDMTVHPVIGLILSILSGCLIFLSFPDYDYFYLEWFSLVPLLIAVNRRSAKSSFLMGLIAGFVTNLGGFYWIAGLLKEFGHMNGLLSWSLCGLLALYQGLVFAFAAGFTNLIMNRIKIPYIIAFPVVFTAIEFITPFLFPWYLGNGQYLFIPVMQIADVTGISGISFLIVFINSILSGIILLVIEKKSFPVVYASSGALIFIAVLFYGFYRISEFDEIVKNSKKVKIGLVEANVGIWEKEAKTPEGELLPIQERMQMLYGNLLRHQFMTASLEKEKPDLIVWPESSYIPLDDVYVKRSDIFAMSAGEKGKIIGLHESGWMEEKSGRENMKILSIHAGREDNIIAVGEHGLALHFDGSNWKEEITGITSSLRGVWVAPTRFPGSAIAVGDQGKILLQKEEKWTEVKSPVKSDLFAIDGSDARNILAAGNSGRILFYDGQQLNLIEAGEDLSLRGVAADKDGGFWVVGLNGAVLHVKNGAAVRIPVERNDNLLGAAAGESEIYAVGEKGSIFRFSVDRFISVNSPVSENLHDAVFLDNSELVIAGEKGTILRRENDTFKIIKSPVKTDFFGITDLPFFKDYPVPADIKYFSRSRSPLPETEKYPDDVIADENISSRDRNAMIRGFSTPILFGGITYVEDREDSSKVDYYNTAVLVDGNGRVLGTYDKNFLLVFGEYIPFGERFPKLYEYLPEAGKFKSGSGFKTFELKDMRIGIMICYEDIIPRFTRRLAGRNANILVNITNDAWFGHTSEPFQHLALATTRAIENRVFLVRSTNTGVSAFIDPLGRILKHTDLDNPETLISEVSLLDKETIYRQTGDVFAFGCCIAVSVMLLISMFSRRKK